MTPSVLLRKDVINIPRMYVENMIILCMEKNVHIIAKLTIIDVWNSPSQQKEEMLLTRNYFKNVLEYCDYSRLCYVFSKFTELSPNMFSDGITFTLSTNKI